MVQDGVADIATAGGGGDATPASAAERRMHLVAYNLWAEMFDNGRFPDAQAILRAGMGDFGQHAVLMQFADGLDGASIKYVGRKILNEAELDAVPADLPSVPSRSILSRLTDHYMQTVANRAPVGFEAEFANDAEKLLLYRGILLPCSSDGDIIDSALGVINWKEGVSAHSTTPVAHDASPLQTKKKKPKKDGAEPKAGQPTPERNPVPVAHQDNENMPKKSSTSERKISMTYETKLNECLEMDGAMAVALVDQASGMALATAGSAKGLNLEVAAAGNTNVMRAKYDTMRELGLKENIEDVLITLDSQYHLIRPVTSESGKGLFVYLVLDKSKANLAMARFKLSKIEKELTV